MKTIIYFSLLALIFISCENPTSNNLHQIVFKTVGSSFSTTDSIKVSVENKRNSNFQISLKCNSLLEMYYQRKNNDVWSSNIPFYWMSSKCASVPYTIQPNDTFYYLVGAEAFDSVGIFRLVLYTDTSVVSNSFEIK